MAQEQGPLDHSGWLSILEQSIDKLIILLTACSIPALASSLARISVAGFQPSMYAHIGIFLSLVFLFFKRHTLSYAMKANSLLVLCMMVSVMGLLNWGLLGNGFIWMLLSSILFILLYGNQAGLIFNLLFLTFAAVVGGLFISGTLSLPADVETLSTSFSVWSTAIIGAAIPLVMASYTIGALIKKAGTLLDALESQKSEAVKLAERDPLTNLFNLRVLNNRLEHALSYANRHGTKVYLFNIDLDNFKSINDTYGHSAGDDVLKFVAACLLKVTRETDTVCRMGGDEFLVLFDTALHTDAQAIKHRIKKELQTSVAYEGTNIDVEASIGIAEYQQNDSMETISSNTILRMADRAMYLDKKTKA